MGTALTKQQVVRSCRHGHGDPGVRCADGWSEGDAAGSRRLLRGPSAASVAAGAPGRYPAEMVIAEAGGAAGPWSMARSTRRVSVGHADMTSPDRDRGLSEAALVATQVPPGANLCVNLRRVHGERRQPLIDAAASGFRPVATAGTQPVETCGPTVQRDRLANRALLRTQRNRWLLAMWQARTKAVSGWAGWTQGISALPIERTVEWLKEHLTICVGPDPEDRELQKMIAALVARADPDSGRTARSAATTPELELAAFEDEIAVAARVRWIKVGRGCQRSPLVDQPGGQPGQPDVEIACIQYWP